MTLLSHGYNADAEFEEAVLADEDSYCDGCQKPLSAHEKCSGCQHYECDCICAFLRDDWPTHPSNPDTRS